MEDDFLWIAGNTLAQMRLLIEGAIVLYEEDIPKLLHIAVQQEQYDASGALDTIGKRVGRRPTAKEDIPSVFYKHYPTYTAKKMNISELARVCGLSRPTVYKYLRLIE